MVDNELSGKIIGAAIEVHRTLGPGLLESVYEDCMEIELRLHGLAVERQKTVPLTYKGHKLNTDLRLDLLVENEIIVELKAVHVMQPVFEAQLLTYLRLMNLPLGLLINFNVPVLKNGIKRMRL
jgi:GxxExxY protein